MKYSTKKITTTAGFTLIELLITIAIIGVLAATVVVSLGSQTDNAKEASIKLGVSSVRTLAFAEQIKDVKHVDQALCKNIHEDVSASKTGWTWQSTGNGTTCTGAGTTGADKDGEVCCHSAAKVWVVWGKISDTEMYCADSTSFVGKVTRGTPANTATVKVANAATKPLKCQ